MSPKARHLTKPPVIPKSLHRLRHELLHDCLDELVADFIQHNPKALPSTTTILELMQWSHKQTLTPTP